MSVIRKLPYIEALLASMTAANLKDLRTVLNTGGSNVNLDFEHLSAATYKNKVTPVYFKFEDNGLKTGILIWTNSMCALICYHRFQDLIIFELSPTYHTSKKINEYCDINELRRVLDDTVESTGAIDSGSAAAGAVPFADGNGGVGWDKPVDYIKGSDFPDGSTSVKMIAIDDDGDLVKVDIPEGTVVVDSALSDSSENPVQNKVITDAITDIQGDVSDIETALETKANVDGNYPTMTVGAADNLTPYDESAGDDQDDPFSFQATGTGNGSQADFATGALALMKEKRGNSVVVNQWIPDFAVETQTVNGITITKVGTGKYQINGTATANAEFILGAASFSALNNQKFLAFGVGAGASQTTHFLRLGNFDDYIYGYKVGNRTYGNLSVRIIVVSGATVSNVIYEPKFVWLTQWFGSNDNIPADLLAHPENWYRYYQGSLAYNAGQIVNANSRYIKCIGRQQWDEETESGYINDQGQLVADANSIRSKNYNRCIPNATYYIYGSGIRVLWYDANQNLIDSEGGIANTTKVAPNNAVYFKISLYNYGGTYNHNITLSIYYEGESGYDQYYPYELLTNNDTGTETLLSAGNVADSKTPDGTITRRIGMVDLGSLVWSYYSDNNLFYSNAVSGIKSSTQNVLCSKYKYGTVNLIGTNDDKLIFVPSDGTLRITDSAYNDSTSFQNAMNGVILYFELATPTTEQGTPFSENLVIDDFGSMEFAGTSGVPQGNLIFYPVDYKAFVDTLYDYTEGTPSDIQLKSDLSTAITTFLTGLTGYDATKKQTLKNNQGTLSWEDDE